MKRKIQSPPKSGSITPEQAKKAVMTVKYFNSGIEACRKQVLKVIKKLEKEYDKAIDIDHLKAEIKEMKVSIINMER